MAKITRKTLTQFGLSGPASSFGQFGSKVAGVPQTTKDPSVIQSLAAWAAGWQNAVVTANKAAYMEDMNGLCYVMSYMIAYLLQQGTPEWDLGTTYYTNSVVQGIVTLGNAGQLFMSLQDTNLNNPPPVGASNAWWQMVNPTGFVKGAATLNTIPKVTNTSPTVGVPGSVTLGDSAISDDGANVKIALPLKFPDNTIQTTTASPVTNQNVVTGSRAMNTVFHNTTGKPMLVTVSVYDAGATPGAAFYTDAAVTPTTLVAQADTGNASLGTVCISAFVLPGNYYKVTGGTLYTWTEWY